MIQAFRAFRKAKSVGVDVGLAGVIAMMIRRSPVAELLDSACLAVHAGLNVSVVELETQHLAGGQPRAVVQAMKIAATRGIDRDFESWSVIDLAGIDVLAVARDGIDPRLIFKDRQTTDRYRRPETN